MIRFGIEVLIHISARTHLDLGRVRNVQGEPYHRPHASG